MTTLRILHVDDEPDIREVVEFSLALDPSFFVRSCGSGEEAITLVTHWTPDMILCDVMMPIMDGPATLRRLRQAPLTAATPVVFMTARAQPRELDHFKSLGAAGVIAKPFDPMTLGQQVRGHMRTANLAKCHGGFGDRLQANAVTLSKCRALLRSDPASIGALIELQDCAHKLSGAAGIFGLQGVSRVAAALEDSAIDRRLNGGSLTKIQSNLDALINSINDVLGAGKAGASHGKTH